MSVKYTSQLQEFIKGSNAPPRINPPNPDDVIDALRLKDIRPIPKLPDRPIPGLSTQGSMINRVARSKNDEKIMRKALPILESRVMPLRTSRTL